MNDFFRPWRRRAGVAVLMMACLLTAAWVRSQSISDELQCPCGRSSYLSIDSSCGFIDASVYFRIPSNVPDPSWESVQLHPTYDRHPYRELMDDERLNWRCQCLGFDVGNVYSTLPACNGFNETFIAVPYPGAVVPLILLSLFLLLSKPRKFIEKN